LSLLALCKAQRGGLEEIEDFFCKRADERVEHTFAMALWTSSLDAETPRAMYLSADDMVT